MACNLPKLKEQLAALAKNGIVNGIPLEIAMIRMTSAYTERMNAVMNKEGSKASKNAAKARELLGEVFTEKESLKTMEQNTQKIKNYISKEAAKGDVINVYSNDKNGYQNLSNLATSPIEYKGIKFPTVEHAYQYMKYTVYGNAEGKAAVLDAKNGFEAQAVGRKFKNNDAAKVKEFDSKKVGLLKNLMRIGFEQNPNRKALLLSTGNKAFTHIATSKANLGIWETEFPRILEELREEFRSSEKESTGKPEDYTIHSGGAYGADTFWGIIGKQFGVKSKHYKSDKSPYVSQTLKADGQVHTPLTDAQIDEGIPEAKRAAELLGHNWTSDVEKQRLLARNWFQVKNADAVYAVAEIKGEYVKGGTGYAVAMAVAHGKPVYVFDPVQGKWYMRDTSPWKPLTKAPPLTQNFAGIGTRTVEQYNIKNKEGKWVSNPEYLGKEVEEKVKAAIREAFENTFTNGQVPTEIKSDNNILSKKTLGGKEVITFADGKGAKIINSLDELVELAEEYNSLVTGAVDESSVKLVQSTFRMLGKMGIEFKPIKVSITRAKVDSNERGLYDINGNVIQLFFNNTHTNASPAQVLLREYIHAITMQGLKDNPELKAKVEALMAHVNKNDSSMYFKTTEGKSEGVYGMKDAIEFLAEAIASPEFKEKLAKIPPYESKNVLDVVKQWFKELLENLRVKDVKEVNALTEALELVIEVAETQAGKTIKSKDVAQEGDQIGDQEMEPDYGMKEDFEEVDVPDAEEQFKDISAKDNDKDKVIVGRYEIQPGVQASIGQRNLIDKGVKFLSEDKKAESIGENILIVQGRGGTGKTSSISRVLINHIKESGKSPAILMMTLSHQAKDVLKGMSTQIEKETKVKPKVEVLTGGMAWYAQEYTEDKFKTAQEKRTLKFNDATVTYINKDAKREGMFTSSMASLRRGDIIVIDEASMLDSPELGYLLDVTRRGVKVILMGDYHQAKIVSPKTEGLAGFGTVTGYSKVFDHFISPANVLLKNAEVHELTEIHRQKKGSNILDFADYYASVVDKELGISSTKPTYPKANNKEVTYVNKQDVVNGMKEAINKGKSAIYIAHTNKDVTLVNQAVRNSIASDPSKEYSKGDVLIAYSNHTAEDGSPIITNSERLLVKNVQDRKLNEVYIRPVEQIRGRYSDIIEYKPGTLLTELVVSHIDDDGAPDTTIYVPKGALQSAIDVFKNKQGSGNFGDILTNKLMSYLTVNGKPATNSNLFPNTLAQLSAGAALSYGYAVTAHKAQGSTVDVVYTTIPKEANLAYVAITRAREQVNIVNNGEGVVIPFSVDGISTKGKVQIGDAIIEQIETCGV